MRILCVAHGLGQAPVPVPISAGGEAVPDTKEDKVSLSDSQRKSYSGLHCHYLYFNRFSAGPEYRITSHSHLFWHVEFVRSGNLVTTVGRKDYSQVPGDAILLPPEVPHAFTYQEKGTTVLSVKFEVRGASLSGAGYPLADCPELSAIREAFDTFLVTTRKPTPARQGIIDHLCAALVHLCVHDVAEESEREPTLVETIRDVVDSREGRPISVGNVASQLGFSESYVRSEFRKQEGISLKEYIDHRRANVAVQYLAYSDMPIKEIVSVMGFPDPQCFSRFCRRVTGISPKVIRTHIQRGSNLPFDKKLSAGGDILAGGTELGIRR